MDDTSRRGACKVMMKAIMEIMHGPKSTYTMLMHDSDRIECTVCGHAKSTLANRPFCGMHGAI